MLAEDLIYKLSASLVLTPVRPTQRGNSSPIRGRSVSPLRERLLAKALVANNDVSAPECHRSRHAQPIVIHPHIYHERVGSEKERIASIGPLQVFGHGDV